MMIAISSWTTHRNSRIIILTNCSFKQRVDLVIEISRKMFWKSLAGGYFGYECKISICIQLEAPPPPVFWILKSHLRMAFFMPSVAGWIWRLWRGMWDWPEWMRGTWPPICAY